MADVINLLFGELGVTIDIYVLIVTILGSLIFMAKDFRLGLVILFLLESVELIIFYSWGYDLTYYVLAVLTTFVLMAVSLLISHKRTTGGIVV